MLSSSTSAYSYLDLRGGGDPEPASSERGNQRAASEGQQVASKALSINEGMPPREMRGRQQREAEAEVSKTKRRHRRMRGRRKGRIVN